MEEIPKDTIYNWGLNTPMYKICYYLNMDVTEIIQVCALAFACEAAFRGVLSFPLN